MDPPLPFFPFPSAPIPTSAAVPAAVQPQFAPPSLPLAPPEAAHINTAHVANWTAPTVPESLNHPPYADMIYAAITALKERDGSSKRAIAKYIETVYTGLPPSHEALLTHNLKLLKNAGRLVMVKKSYKLPNSDPNNVDAAAGNPAAALVSAPNVNPSSGLKRGRGRPPKPKHEVSTQPITQPNAADSVNVPVGLSGQPIEPNAATTTAVVAPQPITDSVKRGRGRPKKVSGALPAMMSRRGRPPKSGRKPGRPKKLKSVSANGVMRVVNRVSNSVAVPYATADGGGGGAAGDVVPRRRGRPKKVGVGGASAAVVQGKRPEVGAGGVVLNPKRRPGRPKKNASAARTATETFQPEAYEDLKTKVEFFQSKVRQAVEVLRPHITNETPMNVVAAIQDLDGIASTDISTPVRSEAPPPPPLPPQPQAQVQPHPPVIQS